MQFCKQNACNFVQTNNMSNIRCVITSNKLNKMAIEIKRSPVLDGKAATAFNRSIQNPSSASAEKVHAAIEQSKKITLSINVKSR